MIALHSKFYKLNCVDEEIELGRPDEVLQWGSSLQILKETEILTPSNKLPMREQNPHQDHDVI